MHLSKLILFLSTIALVNLETVQSFAQEGIVVKLPANNEVAIAKVPAQTSNSTPVVFYYLSKGNLTSKLSVEVYGPKGIETKAEAAQVVGSSAVNTLNKGSFWRIFLEGNLIQSSSKPTSRSYHSQISTRAAVVAPSLISDCASIPPSLLALILKNLSTQEGRNISYEEACGEPATGLPPSDTGLVSPTPTPSLSGTNSPDSTPQTRIENSYGTANGLFQKDNCSTNKNYIVKVTVNLNKVSAEALAQGFDIQARVKEVEYTGGRVASLKPKSDGKFAPRPLLLMQSLGGQQKVNMVKWTKGQPKTLKTVAATSSLAFYRGFVLIRILADQLIGGGRGERVNFELTNGYSVYNVCGPRARVRWKVNGYPGGA